MPKNWSFWTVVLEKSLESPLDCKEIQPVHPKGNQSWIFIGRTDAETETPIPWPPDVKKWLIWKDLDAGKDWRQEEKGDSRGWDGWMASLTQWTWVWVLGVGDGQGSLVCCSPWGCKELDWATQLTDWLVQRYWVLFSLFPYLGETLALDFIMYWHACQQSQSQLLLQVLNPLRQWLQKWSWLSVFFIREPLTGGEGHFTNLINLGLMSNLGDRTNPPQPKGWSRIILERGRGSFS